MAKSIQGGDGFISSIPTEKLVTLIRYYITCNATQSHDDDSAPSYKYTLSKCDNDVDMIVSSVTSDLQKLLKDYFDTYEINVETIEKDDDTFEVYAYVTADGAVLNENLTEVAMRALRDNPYVNAYNKLVKG